MLRFLSDLTANLNTGVVAVEDEKLRAVNTCMSAYAERSEETMLPEQEGKYDKFPSETAKWLHQHTKQLESGSLPFTSQQTSVYNVSMIK